MLTLTELIDEAQKILDEHGDMPVSVRDGLGDIVPAKGFWVRNPDGLADVVVCDCDTFDEDAK